MAEATTQEAASKSVRVNFPFALQVSHPTLDLEAMFRVTEAFDLYEMEKDRSDDEGLVKENILVDVLEVLPERTTMKITPVEPVPYPELSNHVKIMFDALNGRLFDGQATASGLVWDVGKTGVASDIRGGLSRIQ